MIGLLNCFEDLEQAQSSLLEMASVIELSGCKQHSAEMLSPECPIGNIKYTHVDGDAGLQCHFDCL